MREEIGLQPHSGSQYSDCDFEYKLRKTQAASIPEPISDTPKSGYTSPP